MMKPVMKHWRIKLYNVHIYHDPGMTFTCFVARSTLDAYAFETKKMSVNRESLHGQTGTL